MPILHKRVDYNTHGSIRDNMKSQLLSWSSRFLSLVGRVMLTKSVLGALASYTLQSTKLPMAMCDQLNAIIQNFLSGGSMTTIPSLISWKQVTPEDKRRIGHQGY